MAYEKTVWKNNEAPKINATNLNKMENGIANAVETDSEARVSNVVSRNLANANNYLLGHINMSNGGIDEDNNWAYTKVKLKPNTQYTYQLTSTENQEYEVAQYQSNGTYIVGNFGNWTSGKQSYTFTTSNNTDYILIAWRNDLSHSNIQVEEGSVATDYAPYLNLEELQEKSNDTGWLEAPLETDTSTLDWHKLSYRKINGIVYVSGIFKLLNPSWGKVFATLPQGFRPKVEADFACRGVDNATVVVAITNNGKMAVLQLVPGDFSSEVSGLVSCSFIADN